MKSFLLIFLLCLIDVSTADNCCLIDNEKLVVRKLDAYAICSQQFREMDRRFSLAISSGNSSSAIFIQSLLQIYQYDVVPLFVYTIDNHTVIGQGPVTGLAAFLVTQFTFRWTLAAVPNIDSYTDNYGLRKMVLRSDVYHIFTNSTGTFMDFGLNYIECDEQSFGVFRFVWANLTRFKYLAIGIPPPV
jgi:hypothetical protein